MAAQFEHIGYTRDYYVDNKYMGSVRCEKDREVTGYNGKEEEILSTNVKLSPTRTLKKGTTVVTQLIPLQGKAIK